MYVFYNRKLVRDIKMELLPAIHVYSTNCSQDYIIATFAIHRLRSRVYIDTNGPQLPNDLSQRSFN